MHFQEMVRNEQWAVGAGYAPETQDEADALGILTWAVANYGDGDA